MFKRSKAEAPQRSRGGLTSHILLQQGDVADSRLSVTWVDVAPGAAQQEHTHLPEQVYVITRGAGRVRVGDEEQEVTAGDLVYIPANALHSITNTAQQVLSYVSAATPAFDLEAIYDTGPLRVATGKRL